MNGKTAACLIMGLMIVLLGYLTLKVKTKMETMREDAGVAKESAKKVIFERKVVENSLLQMKNDSEAVREYFKVWKPYFEETQTPEEVEQKLVAKIKEGSVVGLSQRFTEVNYKKKSYIPKIFRAHLTFEDEYSKTLNWLGSIEESLPTSRLASYIVTKGQSGNDIKMDLILEIPLIDSGAKGNAGG